MKGVKFLALAFLAAAVNTGAYAQADGYILTRSSFSSSDMMNLSQYNSGFSTSRSASMAGAMTSLGGDLSSASINPAGLGMYRSSEVGITPSMTFGSFSHSSPGAIGGGDNSKSRFALNNIGTALNVYQGSGALTSFTFGFTYNKLADYNYTSTAYTATDNVSIASIFGNQLWGIPQNWMQNGSAPWSNREIYTNEWGAVLAYKTALVDPVDKDNRDNKLYVVNGISDNAGVTHMGYTKSRGSIGEYSLAGGFNFGNKVYFGIALGLQSIYVRQSIDYGEDYINNAAADPISFMYYFQDTKISGTAVNFKAGVMVNPIAGLRIGFAVHTPSYVSIDKEYWAGMYTRYADKTYGEAWTNKNINSYDFSTPTRLLAGVSYTFGTKGLISFDYERTWYNGMGINIADKDRYYWDDDGYKHDLQKEINKDFERDYNAGNTFRVGGEYKILPNVAVRAGYAHMTSIVKNNATWDYVPVADRSYNITAGAGIWLSQNISLDAAYVYMNTKYAEYDLIGFSGYDNDDKPVGYYSEYGINSTLNRHNIMLTLGFRF